MPEHAHFKKRKNNIRWKIKFYGDHFRLNEKKEHEIILFYGKKEDGCLQKKENIKRIILNRYDVRWKTKVKFHSQILLIFPKKIVNYCKVSRQLSKRKIYKGGRITHLI
jgi:hypothetical protein